MSKIPQLGQKFENLPNLLLVYERELEDVKQHLEIEGKTLERANRENPTWLHYYDERRIELKTIVDYLEMHVQRVRGKLFKSYTENHSRELSDRAKEKYIDNEDAYLRMQEIYFEAKETYQKYQSVVETFQARGYALNNITRARVSEVHDVIL